MTQRFASVADDADGFARVFGRQPTAAEAGAFRRTIDDALGRGLVVLQQSSAGSMADEVVARLQQPATGPRVFTLVGHNAGGQLRFPDGSGLDIGMLSVRTDDVGAVLACNSAEYVDGSVVGLPTTLSYEVAFATEQRFIASAESYTSNGDALTPAAASDLLISAFDEVVRNERYARMARRTTAGAAGVAGIGIYEVLE